MWLSSTEESNADNIIRSGKAQVSQGRHVYFEESVEDFRGFGRFVKLRISCNKYQ